MPSAWSSYVREKSIASKLDKKEAKRQEIIYELIQTEKGYLRHLEIIRQLFRQPLIDDQLFMSADQLSGLFANLDQLIACTRPMCMRMSQLQLAHAGEVRRHACSHFAASFLFFLSLLLCLLVLGVSGSASRFIASFFFFKGFFFTPARFFSLAHIHIR